MPGSAGFGPGTEGMPGTSGTGAGIEGMPGTGGTGAGIEGLPGGGPDGMPGGGAPGAPGSPGGEGPGGGNTQPPKYPKGSAEAAVIQLVVNLRSGNYKDMAKVISAKSTNSMFKGLRSGRPSSGVIKSAKSLMGQVKVASEAGARKISETEHQFSLINQRNLLLTFVCRKEDGVFKIYSLKKKASRRRSSSSGSGGRGRGY